MIHSLRQKEKIIRGILLISLVFVIASCAGLGVRPSAKNAFKEGLALFNRGRYEEAIPHFEKATQIDADFAKAYLYLGRSYLNLGKWRNALVPLRTAYRLSPTEARKEVVDILLDALFGVALHELKRGNFREAIGFLREGLELQPESDRARNELFGALLGFGLKLLSEGNAGEAIDVFSQAVELSPNSVPAHLGLARAFFKAGDFRKALQAAQQAIQIDPTNQDAQALFREVMRQ